MYYVQSSFISETCSICLRVWKIFITKHGHELPTLTEGRADYQPQTFFPVPVSKPKKKASLTTNLFE